jgi:hypothetical protein
MIIYVVTRGFMYDDGGGSHFAYEILGAYSSLEIAKTKGGGNWKEGGSGDIWKNDLEWEQNVKIFKCEIDHDIRPAS